MKKISLVHIILFLGLLMPAVPLQAGGVDLTARELFIKKGFSARWINSIPEDAEWFRLPPSTSGFRSVRIRDLGLPDMPPVKMFSLKKYRPEHFTMISGFTLTKDVIQGPVQGLFLKDIGHNWEVFINGHLLVSEVFLDGEGNITSYRNYRDVLVPINPYLLKPGANILAIHIIGDPTDVSTGLYRNGPYLIDNYESLESMRSEKVRLILMFTYLFVGLYHLLLFFFRRSEKYNLSFAVTILFIFIYFFTRTYSIYSLIADTNILFRVEFAVLFMILPSGMIFLDMVLLQRIRIFSFIFAGAYALLSLSVILVPIPFSVDILRLWQVTAIIPLCYILYQVTKSFMLDLRSDQSGEGGDISRVRSILRVLGSRVSGNFLIGIFVIVISTVFDIIDSLYFALDIGVSKYAFLAVIVGMTVVLANRFIYVHRRIDVLSRDLGDREHELHEAVEQKSLSEARYRALVEGANDMVFALDEDWNFISANKAVEKYLKIDPQDISRWNFMDLVYEGGDDISMNREIVRETLEEFKREKKSIHFRTELTSGFGKEPKVMRIRLQYINIEGKNEILGLASSEAEDSLMKYFVTEKQKFVIENFLTVADEVSRRITRNLVRYMDAKAVDLVRIALREIIINAIEHGNLDITFEEKSIALIEGDYMELVNLRQNDEAHRQKRVTIEYSINSKRVIYLVMDEGKGFNHEDHMEESDRVNRESLPHGRGITMAKNVFDEVQYMDRGNTVQLRKNFDS